MGDLKEAEIEPILPNFVTVLKATNTGETQEQTRTVFSGKWRQIDYNSEDFDRSLARQKAWDLELYGFASEGELASYLCNCKAILGAGAGKCGKAAWFASLSRKTKVIAADISDSLKAAAEYYQHYSNLYFVQCDIASMPFFLMTTSLIMCLVIR